MLAETLLGVKDVGQFVAIFKQILAKKSDKKSTLTNR